MDCCLGPQELGQKRDRMGHQLLVRADADVATGSGHVMRTLALAQSWQAHGGEAAFLCHLQGKALRQRLESAGITVIPLREQHPDPFDLESTLSTLLELKSTGSGIQGVPWLVVDGYHIDSSYQFSIRDAGFPLLVIDDTAHSRHYHADILLNQNVHSQQLAYQCDSDTALLLGSEYVLLRPEFRCWRRWRREIPPLAKRILVTIGGSDPGNITLKVIHALRRLVEVGTSYLPALDGPVGCRPELDCRIVVGPSNPRLAELTEAVETTVPAARFQVLDAVEDMAELMAWADICVSASGSTCWELAFMGVPCILLVAAENQASIAQSLDQMGVARSLGWAQNVSTSDLADSLSDCISSDAVRKKMSSSGRSLVDGMGADRVIGAMASVSNGGR
jgi:UDP-2,4-diacetamido-2,4,6-trideoxy-beta-L-altropyranose hydrolase